MWNAFWEKGFLTNLTIFFSAIVIKCYQFKDLVRKKNVKKHKNQICRVLQNKSAYKYYERVQESQRIFIFIVYYITNH